MTAKEYLMQIEVSSKRIIEQGEKIQRLKDNLVLVSPESDAYSKVSDQIRKEEQSINEMMNDLVEMKLDIINKIDALDNDKHRKLLNYKYIDGRYLKPVSELMKLSYDYVKELHGAALAAFEKKWSDVLNG